MADYIGKVEFYKTENARLNKDVAELEKKYKEINEKLKAKYDGELEKMREELKEEKAEKETWKVKVRVKTAVSVMYQGEGGSFLDASTLLYKRVCPSVRPSVGRSVRPSIRL